MKICLVQKKFSERRQAQEKEFRRRAKIAKIHYKNNGEQKLTSGNAREAWQGLNIMVGRAPKPPVVGCSDPTSFAEQLNSFFPKFNSGSTPITWTSPTPSSFLQAITIGEHLVIVT